jgi:hypothetical protein
MMTSLPSSPLPSSITRVAPGLSGVPILIFLSLQKEKKSWTGLTGFTGLGLNCKPGSALIF